MDLSSQRQMAAKILKCGTYRVWIDPTRMEDVAECITRSDIRTEINSGSIRKKPKEGISRARKHKAMAQKRKGRRKGQGSRKGTKNARRPRKREWIRTIRPIRELLKQYREDGVIDRSTYRLYYRQAKGGVFKSKSHLRTQMMIRGDLKEVEE